MNHRNVDALVRLLREAPSEPVRGTAAVAEYLAAQGVLVPSALTDDEADADLWSVMGNSRDRTAAATRAHLERLAKGEA